MWRLHCMVGKENVLKSLCRILLGYNWYINEPFLGWQSGRKKREARITLAIYLFWLKGEKICAQGERKNDWYLFQCFGHETCIQRIYVLVLKSIFNITIKSCIEFTVVELSLASADFTTIPYQLS